MLSEQEGMNLYRYWQIGADTVSQWMVAYLLIYRPLIADSLSHFLIAVLLTALLLFVTAHAEDIERILAACLLPLLRLLLGVESPRRFWFYWRDEASLPSSPQLHSCFQRPPPIPA